jgi:hypothetical protein
MSISVQNLLGKASSIYERASSFFDYEKEGSASVIQFLNMVSKYGTMINANYEVSFSGIKDVTFFVQSINVPEIKRNFTSLYYEGQLVEVPQTIEYAHDFNMTVINDGKGYLYSTISNWLLTVEGDSIIDSGYTMTVRMLGDGVNTEGLTFQLTGVRFKNISGINLSSSDANFSTFQVACSAINYSVVAGQLSKISMALGGIKDAVSTIKGMI